MGRRLNTCTHFIRLTLPAAAVLALLACATLLGCSVQKRTTAPGWHVERASRQASTVQVHTSAANDDSKRASRLQRRLEPVVPRALNTLQLSSRERSLKNAGREAVHDAPFALSEKAEDSAQVLQQKSVAIPDWEAEVAQLLRKEWNARQFGSIYITFGVSWLVAAHRRAKAEQLCAKHGKSIAEVAPEALNLANEAQQRNKWFAWVWLGLVGGTVFLALGLSFLWFI